MAQVIIRIVLTPKNRPPLLYDEEFWEEDWRERLQAICPRCGQPTFSYLIRRWGRVNGVVIYEEVSSTCSTCDYEIDDCREIIPG